MRHAKKGDDDGEWILETEGTNLQEVLAMPGVDFSRTTSNHVLEVLQCLGLEAARHTLLRELRKVIEFDGSYINYRHLSVLCDSMTRARMCMDQHCVRNVLARLASAVARV